LIQLQSFYYIEGHNLFGLFVKELVNSFQEGNITVYSSVITITEVLPKPLSIGRYDLANTFLEFLKNGRNLQIIEISDKIAEMAGSLRGKYNSLKALDSIQLATAIYLNTDAFITNDIKLRQVKETNVIILKDYV